MSDGDINTMILIQVGLIVIMRCRIILKYREKSLFLITDK